MQPLQGFSLERLFCLDFIEYVQVSAQKRYHIYWIV